jgi:hypothetical protein
VNAGKCKATTMMLDELNKLHPASLSTLPRARTSRMWPRRWLIERRTLPSSTASRSATTCRTCVRSRPSRLGQEAVRQAE